MEIGVKNKKIGTFAKTSVYDNGLLFLNYKHHNQEHPPKTVSFEFYVTVSSILRNKYSNFQINGIYPVVFCNSETTLSDRSNITVFITQNICVSIYIYIYIYIDHNWLKHFEIKNNVKIQYTIHHHAHAFCGIPQLYKYFWFVKKLYIQYIVDGSQTVHTGLRY